MMSLKNNMQKKSQKSKKPAEVMPEEVMPEKTGGQISSSITDLVKLGTTPCNFRSSNHLMTQYLEQAIGWLNGAYNFSGIDATSIIVEGFNPGGTLWVKISPEGGKIKSVQEAKSNKQPTDITYKLLSFCEEKGLRLHAESEKRGIDCYYNILLK